MSLSQHESPTRKNGVAAGATETTKRERPETYHGMPVLDLHVDDAIPLPRAPIRYAVRVYPDLARYLLTFNHERNRRQRKSWVAKLARDMAQDRWRFLPQSVVFSRTGVLQDGQHRLMAVIEAGATVYMTIDFGWPDEIITALDQTARRNAADALHIHGASSDSNVSSVIAMVARYETVREGDRARGFSGLPVPSNEESLDIFGADPEGWVAAVNAGQRIYRALDKGLSTSIWGAAHRIIAQAHDVATADAFLAAIGDGTDTPRSATRVLGDWFRRRPVTVTRTRDSREHLENIIRGFNAWRAGKTMSLVTRPGFELSPVR